MSAEDGLPPSPSAIGSRLSAASSASCIGEAIRAGECPSDRVFDQFLPHPLQVVSALHWTPLSVAIRAARWLELAGVQRVVDIGSGAGKFCVAAALAGGATFVGIEQRAGLTEAARELARLFAVSDRVSFVNESLGAAPLPAADAYYLYNPFGENLLCEEDQLGADVELSDARYARDIALVERVLEDAPMGTYLVTYNGFGGCVPSTYRHVRIDRPPGFSVLSMWRKENEPQHGPALPSTAA